MVNGKDIKYNRRTVCVRIASLLLALMFAVMFVSPQFVFAEDEKSQDKPLREVHKVGLENGVYCFFVTHNVVLTPEDISSKTDEELSAYILDKAGLYMKEANCRLAKHKAIQAKDWPEKNGVLFLSATDIDTIRGIEPAEGAPVKMYMDLMISKDSGKTEETADASETGDSAETGDSGETADDTVQPYSTYDESTPEPAKPAQPAKPAEVKKPKIKKPTATPAAPSDEEMLPELRTINMTDRSGPPIEETLKDGSPVSLEWIEPKQNGYEGGSSFTDRFPGGIAGLAVMAAVAAAAVVGVVFVVKRREKEE